MGTSQGQATGRNGPGRGRDGAPALIVSLSPYSHYVSPARSAPFFSLFLWVCLSGLPFLVYSPFVASLQQLSTHWRSVNNEDGCRQVFFTEYFLLKIIPIHSCQAILIHEFHFTMHELLFFHLFI